MTPVPSSAEDSPAAGPPLPPCRVIRSDVSWRGAGGRCHAYRADELIRGELSKDTFGCNAGDARQYHTGGDTSACDSCLGECGRLLVVQGCCRRMRRRDVGVTQRLERCFGRTGELCSLCPHVPSALEVPIQMDDDDGAVLDAPACEARTQPNLNLGSAPLVYSALSR